MAIDFKKARCLLVRLIATGLVVIECKYMTVHADAHAFFDPAFLERVNDAAPPEELREIAEALLGIEIRVAEHAVDLRAFNHIGQFSVPVLLRLDRIREIRGRNLVLREIFLFIVYLFGRRRIK